MKKINFHKYHGTGNDFIMIDNREGNVAFTGNDEIAKICDRRFGIGGDGLILIENSSTHDFKMVYYNADGYEGSMCGNGGRCITSFADFLGIKKEQYFFTAVDGNHESFIKNLDGNNSVVSLKMSDVEKINTVDKNYIINTGSPHYVTFVDDVEKTDVVMEGKKIRYSNGFLKDGINVNFVDNINGNHKIRTYERGVEDETWSCGTGTVAAALAIEFSGRTPGDKSVFLQTKGGMLEVSYDKKENGYSNIWLTGPVEKVYEGYIKLI